MILLTTLATIAAVALGLVLNASRAQVRGLSRELRQNKGHIANYQKESVDKMMQIAQANSKAKTWESRGEELSRRLLVAENDLAAALQKLLTLEAKAANRRELNRLSKQRQRTRRKAEKLEGGEQ